MFVIVQGSKPASTCALTVHSARSTTRNTKPEPQSLAATKTMTQTEDNRPRSMINQMRETRRGKKNQLVSLRVCVHVSAHVSGDFFNVEKKAAAVPNFFYMATVESVFDAL